MSKIFLVFIALSIGVPSSAQGTWNMIHDFRDRMSLAYFIDENVGFAGTGGHGSTGVVRIFKTIDGGETWKPCQVPYIDAGFVASISIKGDIGYAAIKSGGTALWKTVDKGETWFDTSPKDDVGVLLASEAVDAVEADNVLVLSTWSGGAWVNLPPSVVWNLQLRSSGDLQVTNGVATNGLDVVVSGFAEAEWFSHDGGTTWDRANDIPESWSIYSLAGSRSFYAASEGNANNPERSIYRTRDGGESWQRIYTFQNRSMQFTGHIDGKGNRLYIQTDRAARLGMYRSDDLGLTWKSVGGPYNERDTRFSVQGCGQIVYALDPYGRLFKTVDGGDGTILGDDAMAALSFDQDTIYISGHSCKPTTLPIRFSNVGCDAITLDSVSIVGTASVTLSSTSAVTVTSGGKDSLFFTHRDPQDLADTSVVSFHLPGGLVKQVVVISRNILELSFRLGESESKRVGETIKVPIFVSNLRGGITVSRVRLTLHADQNLLANWAVTNGTAIQTGDEIALDLTFNPQLSSTLDLNIPIATLTAINYLTTEAQTMLTLDSAIVTSSGTIAPCSSSSITYLQTSSCGDSTVRELLLSELSGISHISASLVRSFLHVETIDATGADVSVIDMLGRPMNISANQQSDGSFALDCNILPAGSYVVLLTRSGKLIGRRNFIKFD